MQTYTRKNLTKPWRTVTILALTVVVGAIMQTLIIPIVSQLPAILHTDSDTAAWAVTATLLATAITMSIVGYLGDHYGKKKMMLLCMVPLVIGSVFCALAGSIEPMIIGRALQGIGMGIMPLALSLLNDVVPKEKVHKAISTVGAAAGLGAAIGLPFAAAIEQVAPWYVSFWVVTIAGALCILLVTAFVPEGHKVKSRERFDWGGAFRLSFGTVVLLLAVSKGNSWGWTSGITLSLFVLATLSIIAWFLIERRTKNPLVDLHQLAKPTIAITSIATILVGFAMYPQSLVFPQLLQLPVATGYGLGQSMLAMGLWLAPGGLAMILFSPLGSKLTDKRGVKTTLVLGSLIIVGSYLFSIFFADTPWHVMLASIISNIGVGFVYGALPVLVMDSVPANETASANGVNGLIRSLGMSFSATVIGAILAAKSIALPTTGQVIPTLDGFYTALLVGGGIAVAAALTSLTIPIRRVRA